MTGATASSVDNMEWWEYWKLCGLAAELVVEAKNIIHQTDNVRDMLAGETGFEVGMIMVLMTGATASSVDNMEWWEYWKLCGLAAELVVEAKNRIHQTDNVRDMLAGETGFEVGMIMGKIRDKYRTMMELYRMTSNKFVHNPDITLPAMTTIKPLYYIVRMEMIHALEVEIDSLVRVLEALPPRLLEPSTNYLASINQEQLKWAKEMEKYNPQDMEDPSKMEEQMKQYNKDKYLRTYQQQSQIDFF